MFAPSFSPRVVPHPPVAPMLTPLVTGSVPVRPINPDGFVGTLEHDGQTVHVAAIAFDAHGNAVTLLSLVGRDTSVSATLAQIWKKKEVQFCPSEGVQWDHKQQPVKRLETERYKEFTTRLSGLKMVHAMAIPMSAHIADGILNAPPMGPHPTLKDRRIPQVAPRYVLGNWGEETPNALAVLGHLRAMRVVLLYRDDAHPERLQLWASELWYRGRTRKLIEPLPALGVHVWKMHADIVQWNALVCQGVQEGWLPW